MVKHFGKELYFHRLGLEGWMLAVSDEECRDMKQSLADRGPEIARWFGSQGAPDALLESGVRAISVADARAGFLDDVVSVITQATDLSEAEVLSHLPGQVPENWDAVKRKTAGATVPATLWEFMIPTDTDTVALRRPLAVSVDDNLDLVDRSEYTHADYA